MRNRSYIIISIAVIALVFGLIHNCIASEPTVTMLSPSPGQTLSGRSVEIAVGYNTGSSQNVTQIELFLNNKRQDVRELDDPKPRGIISFLLDSTNTDNGSYTISAKVYAGSKLIGAVSRDVSLDNLPSDKTPPSIRFVGLDSKSVWSGSRDIIIEVEDDGDAPPVVSLLVDKTIKGIKNKPPYEFTLDTEDLSDGRYEIEAIAVDAAGNQSSVLPVCVAVENSQEMASVAAITSHLDGQYDADDVKMADSSIAQVFYDDVVTTLDPETGIPVSSEPVVPLASLPSLVALSARSTVFDIPPSVASVNAQVLSSAANTAVEPLVTWSAPVETAPLQNDVSMISLPQLQIESGEEEVAPIAVAEIEPPMGTDAYVETTPVLSDAVAVASLPDAPALDYRISVPSQGRQTESAVAEVEPVSVPVMEPPSGTAARVEARMLSNAVVVASLPDTPDPDYRMSIPTEEPQTEGVTDEVEPIAGAEITPPSAVTPRLEAPVLPQTAAVASAAGARDTIHLMSIPVEESQPVAVAQVQIKEVNSIASLPSKTPPVKHVVLRHVLQRAGMRVSWLPTGGIITATNAAHSMEFQIGADEVLVDNRIVVLSRKIESIDGQVVAPVTLFKELGISEPIQESPNDSASSDT